MTNRRVEYIYTDYYRRNLTRRKWQLIQEFLNLEKFSYRNGFVIKSILIKWKPQLPFYAYFKLNASSQKIRNPVAFSFSQL